MKRQFLPILLAAFISMLFYSCHNKGYKYMREGEIFYRIEYYRNPSTMPVELLPKEMVIAFKNDMISTNLKAPLGNSGISTILDPEQKIFDTYLSFLSRRYCYKGSEEEIQPGFSSMKISLIKDTGKEKEISGYNCREVEVHLMGDDSIRYVWYTKEIDVDKPNLQTPFREIDGVLMDFFYIIGEADIRFTAENVFAREIPDKNFERKEDCKLVSAGYLDSLIMRMISF